MASGTIKAYVPRSDIADNLTTNDSTKVLSAKQGYTLKNSLTTLDNGTAKVVKADLSVSGSEMSVPGVAGVIIFQAPRSITDAWLYGLIYVKQNSNVKIKWFTDEPSVLTVTGGVDKITVTNTATYGILARAIAII